MKIKDVGASTVREVGEHRWDLDNGYVCEIADLQLVKELLTQPGVDFAVADDDPLALIAGAEKAAEMAIEDIQTPDEYRRYEKEAKAVGGLVHKFKVWREERGVPTVEVDMDETVTG